MSQPFIQRAKRQLKVTAAFGTHTLQIRPCFPPMRAYSQVYNPLSTVVAGTLTPNGPLRRPPPR